MTSAAAASVTPSSTMKASTGRRAPRSSAMKSCRAPAGESALFKSVIFMSVKAVTVKVVATKARREHKIRPPDTIIRVVVAVPIIVGPVRSGVAIIGTNLRCATRRQSRTQHQAKPHPP